MHPHVDASPVETRALRSGLLVFDLVYNPIQTRLMKLAEAEGATVIGGLEMFVQQGARQFEIWSGKPAPLSEMQHEVQAAIEARNRNSNHSKK